MWGFRRSRFCCYSLPCDCADGLITPALWRGQLKSSARPLGAQSANLVAAVPSLHAGFATLVAITLWERAPRWAKPLIAAYPVLMGFMLVATGEHYAIDILAGWIYALVAFMVFWAGRGAVRDRANRLAASAGR